MTLNKLHKLISQLIADGHGRRRVCIDKSSFFHNCESDGVTILPVEGILIMNVLQGDEDGGVRINKDGSESSRMTIVVVGGNAAPTW